MLNAAKRAGLKKKVWPHLFRHSRLTLNAKFMTEAALCVFAGWRQGSPQPQIYIHLSGIDLDDMILAHYGLKDKKTLEKEEATLKPLPCPRCDEENPATGRFCFKCSSYLTLEEALKSEEEKNRELEELKKQMAEQKRRLDEQQGIVERFMSYIQFEYREEDGALMPRGILEDMKDKPMGYISKPKKDKDQAGKSRV